MAFHTLVDTFSKSATLLDFALQLSPLRCIFKGALHSIDHLAGTQPSAPAYQ